MIRLLAKIGRFNTVVVITIAAAIASVLFNTATASINFSEKLVTG